MSAIRRGVSVFAVASALALPGSLIAQIPGYQGPTSGTLGADYLAVVLQGVQGVIAVWCEAFTADDLEALADLYVDEALLILPGDGTVRGRDRIVERLEGTLAAQGAGNLFVQDFDASGSMAMVHATYVIEPGVDEETGPARSGLLMMVLIQRGGREWKIRSQTFIER